MGSLSSAITDTDGKRPARLISLTYGATTINGRFITTGRVQTGDGNTYIDLDNNQFRIGNANRAIEYNVNNSGNVKITNATVEIKIQPGKLWFILVVQTVPAGLPRGILAGIQPEI